MRIASKTSWTRLAESSNTLGDHREKASASAICQCKVADIAYGWASSSMRFTKYFEAVRRRPDRAVIKSEWIQRVVEHPTSEVVQQDGRIHRWAPVPEMEGRYLCVVLLPDGETVHNAFFDRRFLP